MTTLRGRTAKQAPAARDAVADLAAFVAAHRDEVARAWLRCLVERSSVEELASTSLADRMAELDALLEAAGAGLERAGPAAEPAAESQVERLIAHYDRFGDPCAVVLVSIEAPSEAPVGPGTFGASRAGAATLATAEALREHARAVDTVVAAGSGACLVLLPESDSTRAAAAAARLVAALEEGLGEAAPRITVGVASCPEDGTDPARLVKAARARAVGPVPAPVPTHLPATAGANLALLRRTA